MCVQMIVSLGGGSHPTFSGNNLLPDYYHYTIWDGHIHNFPSKAKGRKQTKWRSKFTMFKTTETSGWELCASIKQNKI